MRHSCGGLAVLEGKLEASTRPQESAPMRLFIRCIVIAEVVATNGTPLTAVVVVATAKIGNSGRSTVCNTTTRVAEGRVTPVGLAVARALRVPVI